MALFGSSYSSSETNTTNSVTTTTTTIADAFNNALNTTQNFSNIGGVAVPSESGVASFAPFILIGIVAFAVIFLLKKG